MLSLVAACGSDSDDDDNDADTDTTVTTSTGGTTSTEADTDDATEATDDSTASTGDMGDLMGVGVCLQEGTTADVVTDLRDGNTESAEGVYRDCLGDALPPAMVSQLDPIIEQAGECGSDAAAGLNDEDVTAIEEGDPALIEQVTTDTLECLSDFIGMDLQ